LIKKAQGLFALRLFVFENEFCDSRNENYKNRGLLRAYAVSADGETRVVSRSNSSTEAILPENF